MYYDPVNAWLQRNQTALQDDQLNLPCYSKSFQDPQTNVNRSQMYFRARSEGTFVFSYGIIDFRARFPSANSGATSVEFGLMNDQCTMIDCSTTLTTSSVSFVNEPPHLDGGSCTLSYVDPQASDQMRAEVVVYKYANGSSTDFHHYSLVWSSKYVACLIDRRVVANFTNQLALPRGKHFINTGVLCEYFSLDFAEPRGTSYLVSNLTYHKLPNRKRTLYCPLQ